MIADIVAGLLTFLSFIIPGIFISLPLLKKTNFDLFEKLVISFIIGIIVVPSLGFLMGLTGVLYTPVTMLLLIVLPSLIGAFVCLKQKAFPEKIEFNKYAIVLSILLIFGVWVRLQSLGPYFYEFDPYFYQMSAQYIINDGTTPLYDKWMGTPDFMDSHRTQPLTSYMEAQMYFIFSAVKGVTQYDPNLLTIVSGLYPVMVGALIAFIAYLLFSSLYGKNVGVIVASILTFIPQLIQKTAAGSQELQPWGVFSLILVVAFYMLTIKKLKENWFDYSLICGIAIVATILGSQYNLLVCLITTLSFVLLASYLFVVNRDKELNNLFKVNIVLSIFFIIPFILFNTVYIDRLNLANATSYFEILLIPASLLFIALLTNFEKIKLPIKLDRLGILCVVGVIAIIFAYLFGFVDRGYAFAMSTGQVVPLMKTVAEQSPSPDVLFDSLSYLGVSIVPEVVLFVAALALIYSLYIRNSELAIPLLVLILPIAWRGLQTSKYLLQLGIVLALAFGVVVGELLLFLDSYLQKKEEKKIAKYVVYGVVSLFVLMQMSVPVLELMSQGHIYQYLHNAVVPSEWNESMVWIKNNVAEKNEGVVSWWDYGHWINWFGQRRTLTRNDHPQPKIDHMVAYQFVEASPQELASFMRENNVQYVLFDSDLIGKWGALVYLSGVWNHCTSLDGDNWWTNKVQCDSTFDWEAGPGRAGNWEVEHYFEYLSLNGMCNNYADKPVRLSSSFGVSYCLSEDGASAVVEQTGQSLTLPKMIRISQTTFLNLDPDLSWTGKNLTSKLYKSNFVQGFFNKNLTGFDLVFDNEMVKIFKLKGE